MKRLENTFGGGGGRMGGRRERLVMTIFKRNYFYVLDIGWGVSYCTVSYTHLDVYKRQIHYVNKLSGN